MSNFKYHITKADGTPVDPEARYFVLRVDDTGTSENKIAMDAVVHYAHQVARIDVHAGRAAMKAVFGDDWEPVDKVKCPGCGGRNTHERSGVGFEGERRCNDCKHLYPS